MRNSKLASALLLLTISVFIDANVNIADAAAVKPQAKKLSASRHQHDAVSSDPFGWLGPLPKVLDEKVASEAFGRVFIRMRTLMENEIRDDVNLKDFVCRQPGEVGPVPHQHMLEKFVADWPSSHLNPPSLAALNTAASEGNWLARSWLFSYLLEHTTDPVSDYRRSQLMDLLLENKAGVLYSFMSSFYGASGSGGRIGDTPTIFDTYAALHNSYSAQYKVGQHLRHSEIPSEAAAGTRMVQCAMNAVPGYGRLLKYESNSLNMMTF